MVIKKSTSSKKTTSSDSTFKTVKIGKQEWMAENLNVDKFRNGDLIPEAKTAIKWRKAGKKKRPAWCYYDNDPANGEKYGKLYNYSALKLIEKNPPKGWRVPSIKDFYNWVGLEDFKDVLLKMKEKYICIGA